MSSQRQLEIVQALYDASAVANWPAVEQHLTDDFFISEGDHLPFAGVYRGRNALQQMFIKVMGMTGENLQVNGGLTLRRNPTREEIVASVTQAAAARS